jgi:cytochrome c oxidase subunit 2
MQIEPLKQKYEQCLRDFLTQLRVIHIDQLERKWITISLLMIGDRKSVV